MAGEMEENVDSRSPEPLARFPTGNAVHPAASPHAVFNAQRPTSNAQFRKTFMLMLLIMLMIVPNPCSP
jgi:hypothetical protein